MNQLNIIGRLGKEPEISSTNSGKLIAKLMVIVNRNRKNDQGEYDSDIFNVTLWESKAEYAENYLRKGRLVRVSGRMESREYEGKRYWDLIGFEIQGLDRPRDDQEQHSKREPSGTDSPQASPGDEYDPFAD
jgi:single-strand DNA-binding protein